MPLTVHLQLDFQCWDGLSSLILILNPLGNFSLSLSLFFFYQHKNDTRLNIYSFFSSLVYVYWSLPMFQALCWVLLCIFSFTLHSIPCGESYYHHFTVRNMLPGGYVTCLSPCSLWQPPLSLEVTHMAGAEPAWQPRLVRVQAQASTTYLPSYIEIFA